MTHKQLKYSFEFASTLDWRDDCSFVKLNLYWHMYNVFVSIVQTNKDQLFD